ncbi:MAG: sugar-transfer associated ATP-grasp domain-containing protein [Motiliproteus sp.]
MLLQAFATLSKRKWLLPHLLLLIPAVLWLLRETPSSLTSELLASEPVYHQQLAMHFETDGDVAVSTYLPVDNHRQQLLEERLVAPFMETEERLDERGRYLTWLGSEQSRDIQYSASLSMKGVRYEIVPELLIPRRYPDQLMPYLQATDAIPVDHPEVIQLWEQIKPVQPSSSYQVLEAIYSHLYLEFENMPFKGFTDALTALRLQAASCNGKSRLFASLARLNNLPVRLVGGLVLNGKRKKTSHQWVEVYVGGHWVPFDTINGHFAEIPENYLELYRGDQNLFRRTSNINFDYLFDSSKVQVAKALIARDDTPQVDVVSLLATLGLSSQSAMIFILLPFCSLLIAFLRNIVGLKTFGTFMPMLIAAVCVYTELLAGLATFAIILLFAFGGHYVLEKLHILKVPRLAAIMTLISMVTLALTHYQGEKLGLEFGVLALFPAVIITFTADRINDMSTQDDVAGILKSGLGTLLTIVLCYLAFNSVVLQSVFVLYPELLLAVLAGLIYIGSWTGIRVSELVRFRSLLSDTHAGVLGINERNREQVYKQNSKPLLQLAADKLATKAALQRAEIPCPQTLAQCGSQARIEPFLRVMAEAKQFALKPNNGSQGNGILIIRDYEGDHFVTASGKRLSMAIMHSHVVGILNGEFSQSGEEDQAYIEPLVVQHAFINQLSDSGLADIRLILSCGEIISTMLRVPTTQSNGKANLHQGAVGVAVNVTTGALERAVLNGKTIDAMPDSGCPYRGLLLPHWATIRTIAERCYQAVPLGYMGVDICIDHQAGPVVLEVNGRPGLEIQNVQAARLVPEVV